MVRHKRRSLNAIRFLRDFELTGEISIHRQMKPEYVVPSQFATAFDSFINYMDRGYFVDTTGKNDKAIAEYIKNQLAEDQVEYQIRLKEYVDPFTGSK